MEGAAEGFWVTICEIRSFLPDDVYTEANFFRDQIVEILKNENGKFGKKEKAREAKTRSGQKVSIEELDSILDLLKPKEAEQVFSLDELEEQVNTFFI